jgi:Asp-tRNA(Asn)/Glu-tRNA(Gln) amidotransferase A subunit family amidase
MSTLSQQPYLRHARRFASGEDTPRAFLDRCLERYAEWEPKVGAFVVSDLDTARAAADASTARWRAGKQRSALDGMPVGIKDIIETEDMPTEMGSPLFKGWRSGWDAASVAALRDAGAVIVGKTVTTEFAASEPRGTRNPHDLSRTPGGSSSGSAAGVACGMITAGLGTQVLGSVVRPSGFCGVVGFKPTVGALNRGGSHDPLSQSCTGVLAASLEDAWQVAIEIAVRVGGDPGCLQLEGPMHVPAAKAPRRLALIETAGWPLASDEAKKALQDAATKLNASGVEILTRRSHAQVDEIERALEPSLQLSQRIVNWEFRWPMIDCVARDASLLGKSMHERIAMTKTMTAQDYNAALAQRERVRALYSKLADVCDGCITLSSIGAAPVGLSSTGNPIFAVPFTFLGVPALSLPLLKEQNLPLGFQLAGFANRDADAVASAGFVMQALDVGA